MRWMLEHPTLALMLLALLVLLPSPILLQVEFNNAPEVYFPEDAPAVQFDRELRERFPQDQVLVGLFSGPRVFEASFLERVGGLSRALEAHSAIERVLSVTTLDHIRATTFGFSVEPLIDTDNLTSRTPEEWQARTLADPFAPGLVAGRDGQTLAVVLRPHELENSLQRLQMERLLRRSIVEHDLESELTGVAGHIALEVAQLRAMLADLALLVPGTMAVGLLILWWLFRRWLVVGVAAATISAVTGPAIALLILLDRPFTLISAILPPLLTALTAAMLMHFFNALLHADQRGYTGRDRVRQALDAVAQPMLFMSLTTAAGLASLNVSSIRPIGTLGLIGALGVLLAAAIMLWLLPALMARWDKGGWSTPKRSLRLLDRFTGLMSHLAMRKAGWVLGSTVLLLALALPQIRHVEVETDLYAFFQEDHPIIQSTRAVERNLSGVMALEVVFTGPEWDSLKAPERLQAIRETQAWLEGRDEVDYSMSLPDLVAEMHWAFNEEDPAYRAIPDDSDLVAQYLFIYDGRDLYDVVDRDFERSRLLLNLNAHGASEINAFMREVRTYLETNPPADMDWKLAGLARLFADQERLLIQGQLHSLYAVAGMLAVLMLLMWRSVPFAVASMIPNLAPVAMIFALMGLLGIWLDMATAMIASVAIGIAVDDTIHLLHGYRQRRKVGSSVAWALARTFRRTGRAVTATTIVLVGQFVLLALSDFQPTAAFGWLTAFGLLVALLFDLLVLPALLVLTHSLRHVKVRT